MDNYQQSALWQQAFAEQSDGLDEQRSLLCRAYIEFRKRVELLVSHIHQDMPSLTVHDITHLDALWWTASEIAGPGYPLNPAEAFVLGGAFLLHDAAHCMVAYPGGIAEIRALPEWSYFSAIAKVDPLTIIPGTEQFQLILFEVLRTMHPKHARNLAKLYWSAPGDVTQMYLLPHDELRESFADIIGQIAESHWSSPHELEVFNHQKVNSPVCLHPATWTVDVLKIAVLLRTADAAHIDAQRAPRFLCALVKPGESSLVHWQFQGKMNKVHLDQTRNDLTISGSAFSQKNQDAWWMAYDTSRMIDNELRAADRILLDLNRPRLAARSVAFSYNPESFSKNVPTDGWDPIDATIKISDVKSMVDRFGGEKLYGKDPSAALRELLQNAIDAVHACRALGGLSEEEGEIEVAIEDAPDGYWLHIIDTGVGMSRYVLTEVLLDFGHSLWRNSELRGEWIGLPTTNFEAIGQFGIGFFSIFMLGEQVRVLTCRYDPKENESNQWLLEFPLGINKRPSLRVPRQHEKLKRHGTKLSVLISKDKFQDLCRKEDNHSNRVENISFFENCARLAPALDINLFVRKNKDKQNVVKANDWKTISALDLLKRISPTSYKDANIDNYGEWHHLGKVNNVEGDLVGRCAVTTDREVGIGVVKGLFAGYVEGISGLIFCGSQTDLARKSATPNINILNIRAWADDQKILILKHRQISQRISMMLANFGASFNGLAVGELSGETLTYEKAISVFQNMESIKFVYGGVYFESSDNVREDDFDSFFERREDLFETLNERTQKWIPLLDQCGVSRDNWSIYAALDSALQKAWDNVGWEDEDDVLVGEVNGNEIFRTCAIATKQLKITVKDI